MSVEIRDAATVVLLRDGTAGLEVWLLTRVTQMVFAAGMSVFPGGRVDEGDAAVPLAGGDLDEVGRRLGCSRDLAAALVAAAARETFEETGVLLTAPPAETSLDLTAERADVEEGRTSFTDLLHRLGLAVDASALVPWARWVTPEGEVRRYDTRFFVGALPPGAVARDVTSESSAASWLPVADALDEAERGERGLLPPTLRTLLELRELADVPSVLAAARQRTIDPVEPVLHRGPDGAPQVHLPDGTVLDIPRSMVAGREGNDG